MGRPKITHSCADCGKEFGSRQAKYNHKKGMCHPTPTSQSTPTASTSPTGAAPTSTKAKDLTAAFHLLLSKTPFSLPDHVLDELVSLALVTTRDEGASTGMVTNVNTNVAITVNNYRYCPAILFWDTPRRPSHIYKHAR